MSAAADDAAVAAGARAAEANKKCRRRITKGEKWMRTVARIGYRIGGKERKDNLNWVVCFSVVSHDLQQSIMKPCRWINSVECDGAAAKELRPPVVNNK